LLSLSLGFGGAGFYCGPIDASPGNEHAMALPFFPYLHAFGLDLGHYSSTANRERRYKYEPSLTVN
jgi:hypothetical protein